MDTLVYTLITPAHEANADGNIAAVWCFKDAAKSKMRVTKPLQFLVTEAYHFSFKPVQTLHILQTYNSLHRFEAEMVGPKYLHSFANWSINRQNLCISSQTRSLAVAREDALQPMGYSCCCSTYWPSKSTKIDDFHFTWKGLCDFLLVININHGPISHCLATIQPWPTDERTDNRRIVHARDYSIAVARQKEGVCFWGTKFHPTGRIWLDGV